jgi:CheY-like chemotaxis protein
MKKGGAVIVIEDDLDDQELLAEIFQRLEFKNELIFFLDGEEALNYLRTSNTRPFIILSDINVPRLNGMSIRDKINSDPALRLKCIPFIFYSTAASPRDVVEAYTLSVQGFFQKEHSLRELEQTISIIMQYWERCIAPNRLV